MPKIKYRKIYDDDGDEMLEGSEVLVNDRWKCIIHFDEVGEIWLSDFPMEEVETIQYLPDDRCADIEDNIITTSKEG